MDEIAPPHILFVEADTHLATIYSTAFEQAGYAVTHLDTGAHVVAEAERYMPDVIVMDILLPHTNGFDILHALQQHPRLMHIPRILLTSLGQREDIEKGMSTGVEAYFIKSYTKPKDIVQKIQKICPH